MPRTMKQNIGLREVPLAVYRRNAGGGVSTSVSPFCRTLNITTTYELDFHTNTLYTLILFLSALILLVLYRVLCVATLF